MVAEDFDKLVTVRGSNYGPEVATAGQTTPLTIFRIYHMESVKTSWLLDVWSMLLNLDEDVETGFMLLLQLCTRTLKIQKEALQQYNSSIRIF
jgi:hypothetical protein